MTSSSKYCKFRSTFLPIRTKKFIRSLKLLSRIYASENFKRLVHYFLRIMFSFGSLVRFLLRRVIINLQTIEIQHRRIFKRTERLSAIAWTIPGPVDRR